MIDKISADLRQESDAHEDRLRSIAELCENQLRDNSTAMNQLNVSKYLL